MAILNKPTLGTSAKAWQYHACHMTGSLLLKEFFDAGYYRAAIDAWEHGTGAYLSSNVARKSASTQAIETISDHNNRAKSFKNDEYHELNSHCFINMWSAFEAGLDNIVADYIQNDETLRLKVNNLVKNSRISEDIDYDDCLQLAARLQLKLKEKNFTSRLVKLFEFIELPLDITENPQLDEAHAMRNIIMHRYGEVRKQDADKFPALSKWIGKVMPINSSTLGNYYNSMTLTLLSILRTIPKSRYVSDES